MRQRVLNAMALACEGSLIVAVEPTIALDVAVEAQILNLVDDLQETYDTRSVWAANDMDVVAEICDRVNVVHLGVIVDLTEEEELNETREHPYPEVLPSAIPVPDPRSTGTWDPLEGAVPSPIDPPSGCRFRTRCPKPIAPAEHDLTDGGVG